MSDVEDIREAVDQAKARGTFNITNVLKERAYPKSALRVVIDESLAFEASSLRKELESTDLEWARREMPEEVEKLQEKRSDRIAEIKEEMAKSSFTFFLSGIAEGDRERIYKKACAKYPLEYDKDFNLETGRVEKVVKESEDRDSLFTDLLWEAHIEKIEDPEGNVHEPVGFSDVRVMRETLPLSVLSRINEEIEKIRVASAVFMLEVDDDFLAKP